MKRPHYSQFERMLMINGTLQGDAMMLGLRFLQLGRAIAREYPRVTKVAQLVSDKFTAGLLRLANALNVR